MSHYVTSKGRIITEQMIGENVEESGRFHNEVTPGDFRGTEINHKKPQLGSRISQMRFQLVTPRTPVTEPAYLTVTRSAHKVHGTSDVVTYSYPSVLIYSLTRYFQPHYGPGVDSL
jgi:hypothetical protein